MDTCRLAVTDRHYNTPVGRCFLCAKLEEKGSRTVCCIYTIRALVMLIPGYRMRAHRKPGNILSAGHFLFKPPMCGLSF